MDQSKSKKKYATKQQRTKKQYPIRYFPRNSGLIGLTNLGNTCYMNAALQALSNCPQLTSYMLENFDNMNNGLAKSFALLLYEIWVHGCVTEYSSNYFNHSKVFYDYLTPTSILYGIKNACPNFRSSAQQEDAQEFLRCFLDQMHEELKVPIKELNVECSNEDSFDSSDDKFLPSVDTLSPLEDKSQSGNFSSPFLNEDLSPIENSLESTHRNCNGHNQESDSNDENISMNNQLNSKSADQNQQNEYSQLNNQLDNRITNSDVDNMCFEMIDQLKNDENDENFLNRQPNNQANNQIDEETYSKPFKSVQADEAVVQTVNDLLDNCKDEENNEDNEKKVKEVKKKEIEYQSIISKMFDGEILNSVQCLTCKNVSTIKETFQDLSLPIPSKDDDLLQTRQAKNYLKKLEINNYNYLDRKVKSINSEKKLKNGLIYKKLNNDSDADSSNPSSNDNRSSYKSSNSSRLVKLPILKYFFIFLLYMNYFFKSYIIYSLISFFYWSHSNIWGPTITLNDCLDAFFSTDELKDNNMYSCEKCKKLRNGIKYTNLVKSPDILCIHFKRFRNELMFPSKISTYVSFPIRNLHIVTHQIDNLNDNSQISNNLIDDIRRRKSTSSLSDKSTISSTSSTISSTASSIANKIQRDHESTATRRKTEVYDLVSVICHRGHYSSGHYITYALNCLDDCWYEYDDKSVCKVDENKVLNCEAYVLFYRKNSLLNDELVEEDLEYFYNENAREIDEDLDSNQINNVDEPLLNNEYTRTKLNRPKLSFLTGEHKLIDKIDNEIDNEIDKNDLKLTKSEQFRKRRYEKITGKRDYLDDDDILGNIKL